MAKLYWIKKIGDAHIMGKSSTLCGKPMLGNNYANKDFTKLDNIPECDECTKVFRIKTFIEKNYSDYLDAFTITHPDGLHTINVFKTWLVTLRTDESRKIYGKLKQLENEKSFN